MVRPGDPAPDFALETDTGETIRLSDLRGRSVVLFFYPKDDTSGCTEEVCGFRDHLDAFAERGWTVLGVSPDGIASHRRFKDKYDLNFRLLADPDHTVADAYGAWGTKRMYGREYEGILRSTFLIGADGRVARVYEKVKPTDHAEEILADLDGGTA
ncbi:MAG: thioredoxin-dependent thiol peroxidase [Gemmatimonadota bacterium]